MALQKSFEFKGITVQNGYLCVLVTEVTRTQISYMLSYHVAVEHDALTSVGHTCQHDLDGPNALAQAYQHAKTLPELAGATDI